MFGLSGQSEKFLVNGANEGIRAHLAVVGDVIPYFDKISLGARAFDDDRYLYLLAGVGARVKPLAAFPLDFFGVPRCRLAAVEAVAYILPPLFELGRAHAVLFFHKTQRLADNLACGCVEARRYFLPDHFLKLRG